MSLKRKNSIFKTVKFRIALLYALLFAVSSVSLFLAVYYFLYAGMMKNVDEKLIAVSRNLEEYYLKGERYEEDDAVPFVKEEIPEGIVSAARNSVKNLTIVRYEKIMNEDSAGYEFIGIAGGMIYEIRMDEKGKVTEIEKYQKNEAGLLQKRFITESHYEGEKKMYLLLVSKKGEILAKSDLKHWPGIQAGRDIVSNVRKSASFRTLSNPGLHGKTRVCTRLIYDGNILEIGIKLSGEEKILKTFSSIFLSVFIASLVIGAAAGWLVARKSMSGVNRISEAAISIGQGDFSNRVSCGNEGEEIENLVSAFNEMISKIDSLVRELHEVTDNIAHDLRTPLTRIRGTIETTVNSRPGVDGYLEMSGDVVEECDRLIGMINTMLEITRADSGMLELSMDVVDINEVAMAAFDLFTPMSELKHIEFKLNLLSQHVPVSGDVNHLQRVVANLLDNAIKYTPEKGRIMMSVGSSKNYAEIIVSNTGCGISDADLKNIFDRFFRSDTSRSQPGNGLGLSLAQSIVKAHGGTIAVESKVGSGSSFKVSLPIHPFKSDNNKDPYFTRGNIQAPTGGSAL